MYREHKMTVIVAIAVTMAFVMPVTAFINDKESNNSEMTAEMCHDAKYTDVAFDALNLGVLEDRFYAYNAYDPSGVLKLGPVYFDSENPGSITLLKETMSPDFIAGGTWVVDTWYGCEYDNGQIYIIDESTGTMTLIGGGGISLNGLAYDPTNGVMYGASSYDLYTINMSSGAQTLVGPFNAGVMIGIAFDGKGTLYGEDIGTDCLYSINTLNGAAKLIGPLGIDLNYAQDMAYDINWDVLYLAAYTGEGALYTCNVTTGKATKVGTFQGRADITGFAIPYIITHPPEIPDGPSEGVVRVKYTFSTRTTDPEGEKVSYMWDWGDETPTEWTDFYDSGVTVYASHIWTEPEKYNITVKAKDVYGIESAWSDPKTIYIVDKAILEIGNITGGIGKISIVIKNIGSVDAIGVDWNLTLNGGLIIIGRQKTGRRGHLPAQSEISVSSDLIIGFGNTVVNVYAEIPESSAAKEQNAFVLLFFIKILDT